MSMNHWFTTLGGRIAALGSTLLMLAACGGGGGGGGGFLPEEPGSDLLGYTLALEVVDEAGSLTDEVTATRPATLRVTVAEDNPQGAPVSGVVVLALAEFLTIVPDNGQALTNAEGVAEFEIRAGEVLGADEVQVSVESPAGQVVATVGVQAAAAGLRIGSYDGTAFRDGQLGLSADSLPFGGSAIVRVAVIDEDGKPAAPQQIRLTSGCSLSGTALLRNVGDAEAGSASLTLETVDGLAGAEYLAGTCEGDDTLTAELISNDAVATALVTIADRDANYIGFVSADPSEGEEGNDRTIIALRGTGGPGRPEIASLTFEVLAEPPDLQEGALQPGDPGYLDSENRSPLAGIEVAFALTNSLGGLELVNASGVTDANGLVSVEVRSGNVATSTFVTARFEADGGGGSVRPLEATSNQIVVSTGLADQNSISLSSEVFHVPRARDFDGIQVAVTVRMADKFNNPVADGTSAVFTTEYGAIDSSCLTGESNGARYQALRGVESPLRGTCTVLWISQAPRLPTFNQDLVQTILDDNDYDCPSHTGSFGPCPDDLGAIRGLRSTVLVTAIGEESFVDSNGNGLYDRGEPFDNLPEAFIDHNEDGVYTPALGPRCPLPSTEEACAAAGFEEEFIDFNEDGVYSTNVDPNTGEGVYNGSLCPPEGDGDYCSRSLLNVRASTVLTLSASEGGLTALAANRRTNPYRATVRVTEGDPHTIYIADRFNNGPSTGTTIAFSTSGDCALLTPEEVIVPERGTARGAFGARVAVEGDGGAGELIVTATDPADENSGFEAGSGTVIATFSCSTSAPPDPNDVTTSPG
jgi:hypothetical protein